MNTQMHRLVGFLKFAALAIPLLFASGLAAPRANAAGSARALAAEAYTGQPLIWPFAPGNAWRVTAGYNTIYHGGNDHRLGNYGDKFTFDLVRADGSGSTGRKVYATQDGQLGPQFWMLRLYGRDGKLGNYYAYYGHINLKPELLTRFQNGEKVRVRQGDLIGTINSDNHLHFGIARWNGSGAASANFPNNSGWVPVTFSNICGTSYPFNGKVNQYLNTVIEPCAKNWSPTYITARHSGKYLEVAGGSRKNGAQVRQWQWHPGRDQLWRTKKVGDYYLIISLQSGKCLDVKGPSQESGVTVYQWECHRGANQQWKIEKTGSAYRIVSRYSGKCLDIPGGSYDNGVGVIQWDCHGGSNQLWKLDLP
jgi:hypothetical protein